MNIDRRLPRNTIGDRIDSYFDELNHLCVETSVIDLAGRVMTMEDGFDWFVRRIRALKTDSNAAYFIGNGGSASIASHQAIDYANNCGVRALSLNDAAALTCFSNDYGYADVYRRQLEIHGRDGDMLVAISSSGQSDNILNAVQAARDKGMYVTTFSGFRPDNPLRRTGDVNFHVDSDRYGFVELAHLSLIHAILDIHGASMRRA